MNETARPFHDRFSVDLSLLIVRVIVGAIFFAHGGQKLFGLFGGPGLEATVEKMGTLGYFVAVGECIGGLGILVGFLARFSAAANIVIMIGAIALVHGQFGFFMNPPETELNPNGIDGFEYNLALIGLLAPILLAGPGRFSLGRCLPLPKSKRTGRPTLVLE